MARNLALGSASTAEKAPQQQMMTSKPVQMLQQQARRSSA
jgi:hypothetical protein